MDKDIEKQVQEAEDAIKDKRATVVFPEDGTAIEIDGELYEVPKMVFNLIVDAIASNQHLAQANQDLKDYIARSEIMRGVS
ncbi:MAG: hypothetical protein H8D23_18395 [Candidatus Brocadiales bacterium]|nr:hypothetical protein [Candidatus Brocadiales bacterium]